MSDRDDAEKAIAGGLAGFWENCDYPFPPYSDEEEAILAALDAAGFDVIRRPEPVRVSNGDGEEWTEWVTVGLYAPVVFDSHPDVVQVRDGAWCDEPLTPGEARDLAAALLAAANLAEEES
jgi:acetylornithine deacetylase/succinyl-diaminopimelate desuccinylase-like protein